MKVNKLTHSEIKKRRMLQGSLKLFGKTQKDIAKKIGKTPAFVSMIFSGERVAQNTFSRIVELLQNCNSKF